MSRTYYYTCRMCGREALPDNATPPLPHRNTKPASYDHHTPDLGDTSHRSWSDILSLTSSSYLNNAQIFAALRWPSSITCPKCLHPTPTHYVPSNPQPYHCSHCRKHFSSRTNSFIDISGITNLIFLRVLRPILLSPQPLDPQDIADHTGQTLNSVMRVHAAIYDSIAVACLNTGPQLTRQQVAILINTPQTPASISSEPPTS